MAVQPFKVRFQDHPSKRSTILFSVMTSAYLPQEQGSEDSAFIGLDLGSYLRELTWGLALTVSGVRLNFATTDFVHLTPLIGIGGSTRIHSYQSTFETDVDPGEGDFSA